MPDIAKTIRDDIKGLSRSRSEGPSGYKMAELLDWTKGTARVEPLRLVLPMDVTRGLVGDQPAALFVGHVKNISTDLLDTAALLAYHSSIEWGLITDVKQSILFNSHWIRNNSWFSLPPIDWKRSSVGIELLEALTPSGLTLGLIDELALKHYSPDRLLLPVDDALVDRLDHWREETLRFVKAVENVDSILQELFAQFFVLRAVEDRNLAPQLPRLDSVLCEGDRVNRKAIDDLFSEAKRNIQSELFNGIIDLEKIPDFVLGGIIRDLYVPHQLPGKDFKYNFAWIDADILGRAYEKYLSTVLVPSTVMPPQIRLWDQPYREIERVTTARKISGVYYTPSFLVRNLTEQCLDRFFRDRANGSRMIPRVADLSCGSGSFLTAAVDSLIRRLRDEDPNKNWGRELVNKKCIIGIDIDPRAVTITRLQLWLRLAEEPHPLPLPRLERTIVNGDSLKEETWDLLPAGYDVILGNPPFIATGDVQSRKELAARFKSAQGRFDYSYLFVEMAIRKLKNEGVIGLVIPNRLFTNKDASALRKIITSEMNLCVITDFGSNEIFVGTSSYIGTFIAKKNRTKVESPTVRFVRVLDLPPRFVGAVLAEAARAHSDVRNDYLTAFEASHPRGSYEWRLLSDSAVTARARLAERSESLPTIAGIYQGIRTGANDVFIVTLEPESSGTLVHARNGFGETHLIETALLRPVIFGSDIQRYDYVRPKQFLIYPYHLNRLMLEQELRSQFPQTLAYLSRYRHILAERSTVVSRGGSWYALSWPRDETWLNSKKLLIRDLATETSFALDDIGNTYLVGGTAVVPADEQLLYPLLGYLNSALINWYLTQITPAFRADFQKFEPQHLSAVPVLREVINEPDMVDALTPLVIGVLQAKQAGNMEQQRMSEFEINQLICNKAGVDTREIT